MSKSAIDSHEGEGEVIVQIEDAEAGRKKHSVLFFESNADIYLERYSLERSFFDQVSLWYGERRWYEKAGLALTLAAPQIIAGIFLSNLILLGVITASLLAVFHGLLSDHARCLSVREERLGKDVRRLEKNLREEIEKLLEIKSQLSDAANQLRQEIKAMSQNNTTLQEACDEIKNQNDALSREKNTFEVQVKSLEGNVLGLEKTLQVLIEELASKNEIIETLTCDIGSNAKCLSERVEQIDGVGREFEEIKSAYRARIDALSDLCNDIGGTLNHTQQTISQANKINTFFKEAENQLNESRAYREKEANKEQGTETGCGFVSNSN